jgi:hypothetical protein
MKFLLQRNIYEITKKIKISQCQIGEESMANASIPLYSPLSGLFSCIANDIKFWSDCKYGRVVLCFKTHVFMTGGLFNRVIKNRLVCQSIKKNYIIIIFLPFLLLCLLVSTYKKDMPVR